MSPIQEQLVIDFAELQFISVTCSECQTELKFDCRNPKAFCPEACPSCKEKFDSLGIRQQLDSYRDLYRVLAGAKHKIKLHIRSHSASSKSSE